MSKFEFASIHGRFQPFHLGHFAYLKAAFLRADRVYIGLTRVLTERAGEHQHALHRDLDSENPLSYFERVEHIRAALKAQGIDRTKFDIGPFPIENVERLPEFWPTHLPCLTTRVTGWNDEKIRLLTAQGYHVEVLDVDDQDAFRSGSEIRALIRAGDAEWKDFVPGGKLKPIFQRLEAKFSACRPK